MDTANCVQTQQRDLMPGEVETVRSKDRPPQTSRNTPARKVDATCPFARCGIVTYVSIKSLLDDKIFVTCRGCAKVFATLNPQYVRTRSILHEHVVTGGHPHRQSSACPLPGSLPRPFFPVRCASLRLRQPCARSSAAASKQLCSS